MVIYGLYDIKNDEQCVFLGNIREISEYLECDKQTIYDYLYKHKIGKHDLIKKRYEIIKICKE